MNKVIRLGMVFNEGDVPDFGSVVGDINQEGLYYLLAEDIPKLNTMLTRAAAENYLTGNDAFPFFSGYMAYVTDYKDAGTGEIYAYHRGSDHWYEFNIRLDKSFNDIMWERHKRILRETKTISGTSPLTFMSNGRPLKNYRIYGNTENGESVGNLVDNNENYYYGRYNVPIIINGITKNIYLNSPLRKIGNDCECIDYKKKKLHRLRKNQFHSTIIKGSLTGNGDFVPYNGSLLSGYTRLVKGTYTISCIGMNNVYIAFYDSNKQYKRIENLSVWESLPHTFSIPEDGYIRCVFKNSNPEPEVTDISNIQIEYGLIATEYEAYIENTEISLTLPGISTNNGLNTFIVDTLVQPELLELTGKLSIQ